MRAEKLALKPAPYESIVQLAKDIIAIPSRAHREGGTPVLKHMSDWLRTRGLEAKYLETRGGRIAGLLAKVSGSDGRTLCLDACADTAPFGDVDAWTVDPAIATERDGWLYGRGAADSKIAISIFAHLCEEMATSSGLGGRLLLLFDSDEHTGGFAGVKAFLREIPDVDGVMIGYPGNYGVVIGSRGFYRVRIDVFGTASHSGGAKTNNENAALKASRLAMSLAVADLPEEPPHSDFPFGPKLTVTQISGGSGYSIVPDRCYLRVDVRLTQSFTADEARSLITEIVAGVDDELPTRRSTKIQERESWPAYKLPVSSPLADALINAASHHLGRKLDGVVSGPSNIGNFLAKSKIPTTSGFGVTYRNLHGPDEAVELASIPMVYETYRDAVLRFLNDNYEFASQDSTNHMSRPYAAG